MRSNKGFTLIELIVVIVVLGILAVTAAPKFIGVQDEAREAAADGVLAAVQSASSMAHGKALVTGETGATGTISVDGVSAAVTLEFGYPNATSTGIGAIVEGSDGAVDSDDATKYEFTLDSGCVVTYTEAEDADTPATAEKTCP